MNFLYFEKKFMYLVIVIFGLKKKEFDKQIHEPVAHLIFFFILVGL